MAGILGVTIVVGLFIEVQGLSLKLLCMQKSASNFTVKILALCVFLMTTISTWAQDKVEIDTHEVKTWFERNWMWVVGALILIILIAAVSRNRHTNTIAGGKRKTTTVIEDAAGNTKSVTTTEENI